MKAGEEIILQRDCQATEIPSGRPRHLSSGTAVRLRQALGGSYTVTTPDGYMVRIDAGEALGIAAPSTVAAAPAGELTEKAVWEQLRTIYDPEIPVNIADLGLIYSCQLIPVEGGHNLDLKMSMTAPGCGMAGVLKADVERKLSQLPGARQVNVQIVFDPPWGPERMSEAARLQLGLDVPESPLPVYKKRPF